MIPEDEWNEGKLDLVQGLWDAIAAESGEVQVPEWRRRKWEQRLAAYRRDPNAGTPRHVLRAKLHLRSRAAPHIRSHHATLRENLPPRTNLGGQAG